MKEQIDKLLLEMEQEVTQNIIPFWIENAVDYENGGFYGFISNDLIIKKEYDKSSVICSRILWTFSKAYSMFGEDKYLKIAHIAYNYILDHFWDAKNDGVYWSVDYKGKVANPKKQTYAQAFALYGICEYYKVTKNEKSIAIALTLFECMENYCYDKVNGGYIDALSQNWGVLEDTSLSDKDMNVAKTMNTNLHVMEAYTGLLSVYKDDKVKLKLKELVNITIEKIIVDDSFKMYFNNEWVSQSNMVSYGHDIEGSWLLLEAAEILDDKDIIEKARNVTLKMVDNVAKNGIDNEFGGIYGEFELGNIIHTGKEWWQQAEAVVGFYNAYQITLNSKYLNLSIDIWEYIKENFIDKNKGEWFLGIDGDSDVKVGPWKCPYHNSRMCFEMITRIKG